MLTLNYMVKETARNAFEACLQHEDEAIIKINEISL